MMKIRLILVALFSIACMSAFSLDKEDKERVVNAKVQDIENMLTVAKQQMNKPYSPGARGPESFDGAGLAAFAYGELGVNLPMSEAEMMAKGKKVKKAKKLEEGDIVFFNVNNETVVAIVDKMKDDDSFDLIYVSKEHGVTVGSSAYPPFAGNFKSAVRITSDKELKNIRKEHKKAVKDAEKKQKEIEKAEKKAAKAQKEAEKAQKKLEKANKKLSKAQSK